ncbi:intermembrane phospholipid transport protein YdbH family protein [Desulfobulbus alkaliphilus]|uniref:intermembrane phospholipid transport protein YdbH family protein n=1 Tax=Desulfobulbus alkaliphilus TaxID=869814 RepID=UPI001965F4E3|nr:YdbH domain-containing protein [Desulfobulbus alkaliphilus]MBM9538255.1 YdbH domain-containing protein [Desulfobulbus alkaliphilus]
MRSLVATLSLIALLVGLMLLNRVQLINWFAPHLLPRAGLHDVSLELTDLNINRVRIDRFSTTIILPSGPVDIQIRDLVCHYHYRGLLHGKVETITATAVQITLPPATADDPSPVPDLFSFDPVQLLQQIEDLTLPVQQLQVNNLHLYRNGTTIASLQLTASGTETGKKLIFTPPAPPTPDMTDQSSLVMATDAGQLSASLHLDLAALPALLPKFETDFLPQGRLQADLLLRVHPGIEPQLLLDMTGTNLQHPLLTAAEVQLQLDIARLNSGGLLLTPASTLAIKGAKSLELSLDTLTARLKGHLDVQHPFDPQSLHLQLYPAQLLLEVTGTSLQHPLLTAAEVQLQLDITRLKSGELLLSPASILVIKGAKSQELSLDALTVDLAGQLNIQPPIDPQSLHFQLYPAQLLLEVTGTNLQHPLLTAVEVQLQLDIARHNSGGLLLTPASTLAIKGAKSQELSLNALTVELAGYLNAYPPIDPQILHLQLRPLQPWRIDGLQTGGLRFAPLQIANLVADLHLDRQQLRLIASCSAPRGTGSLVMTMSQQLDRDQKGSASLHTDGHLVMTATNNLLQMLHDPHLPLTLEQGQIKMATQWAWSRTTPVQAELEVDLTVDQGQIAEVPFIGLTAEHKLHLLPRVASSQPGLIRVDQVQGPVVPMSNLYIRAGLDPAEGATPFRLHIEKAEVELLGGRIELEECLYDFDRPENSCLLTIREMEMEQIVTMQKVEGLTVDGRIEGHLPLVFTARGIQVDQGRLEQVDQGGILRYRPPGGAPPGSPLTDYALKALEEFHYQQLAAQVEYIPDGTLIIALQLQGRSPSIKPDRPLHFNVTVEQNLLSLLQSLQYSQGLPADLQREIRR